MSTQSHQGIVFPPELRRAAGAMLVPELVAIGSADRHAVREATRVVHWMGALFLPAPAHGPAERTVAVGDDARLPWAGSVKCVHRMRGLRQIAIGRAPGSPLFAVDLARADALLSVTGCTYVMRRADVDGAGPYVWCYELRPDRELRTWNLKRGGSEYLITASRPNPAVTWAGTVSTWDPVRHVGDADGLPDAQATFDAMLAFLPAGPSGDNRRPDSRLPRA